MDERCPTGAELVARLGGNPHNGMCRCPCHDDRKASLSIDLVKTSPDGMPLAHCFACDQEVINAWLRTQKPERAREQVKRKRTDDRADEIERFRKAIHILRAAAQSKEEPPADYLAGRGINIVPLNAMLLPAADAALLTGRRFPAMVLPIMNDQGITGAHVTYLTGDKTQNCRDRDGGSVRRTFGTVKGAYIAFGGLLPQPDKPLIAAEGVESALSAAALTSLPAIAAVSAGNMREIDPPPCAEIILAGDNDRIGREKAEAAAGALTRPGRPVRVAIPEDHNDWNEALCDPKADREELRRAIMKAERRVAVEQKLILTAEEFLLLASPEPRFLLKPWLTTGSTGMIHAARGAGKTWVAMQTAHAVASGQDWLNWKVEQKGRVLYVDAELPIALVQARLRDFGPAPANLSILSMEHVYQQGATMPDLGQPEGQALFDRLFEEHQPDLVILDPLTALVRSGGENEAEPWVPVQHWMLKHRFRGRTILWVHHEGRSGKQRGTSKREDVLDVMVGLKERKDLAGENDSAIEWRFTKSRRFYGADAAPRILRLSTAPGQATWREEPLDTDSKARVAEMLEQGYEPAAIMKETGLSKGRISQIKKEVAGSERV